MLQPGRYNTLRVVKEVDFGIYLDGGEQGEILLPAKYVPQGTAVDDEIEVLSISIVKTDLLLLLKSPILWWANLLSSKRNRSIV